MDAISMDKGLENMRINVFRLCAGLKVLGNSMILLVATIVGVSYYAVVVLTWGPRLLHATLSLHFFLVLALLLLFHLLLILLVWSYFMVAFTDPGVVPRDYGIGIEDPSLATTAHCTRCQNGKPPRSHHCSICQRCVLKMDHHCVWVVNCIGACNYKFFLLFLLYTFLETTLVTFLLLPSFILFFSQAKGHHASAGRLAIIFLASVLNLAFSLSLLCFLIMHASLLFRNITSIEVYEQKKGVQWKYDLGRKKNFEQVFGTKKGIWLFPLYSVEDIENIPALRGLEFQMLSDAQS